MNKQIIFFCLFINCLVIRPSFSQDLKPATKSKKTTALFANQEILPVKMSYSIREIRRDTNDTTYIKSILEFQNDGVTWESIDVRLRARGNFRLKTCYFPPVKIKIKKSEAKGTLFKGSRNLKAVLPCLNEKDKNDNVIKEFMAYKIFETVSPYYFNTRLLQIEYEEIKNKKSKSHQLMGFLIEDDSDVADRFKGKVVKTMTHPLAQDTITSIRNSFFQFMIGNTDFSVGYQHNAKLIYFDKTIKPIPYDFDMAGLVNASYAKVPTDQGEGMRIVKVTQRKYRGFKRDLEYFEFVRKEFISNKEVVFKIIDDCEPYFENPNNYIDARNYIAGFYAILDNDQDFKANIVSVARTK